MAAGLINVTEIRRTLLFKLHAKGIRKSFNGVCLLAL
jgi:hypothetical protein